MKGRNNKTTEEPIYCLIVTCDTIARAKGLCPKHHRQASRGKLEGYSLADLPNQYQPKNWWITSNGYKGVVIDGRQILEHRYVMEILLDRELLPNENVHHKDGDKLNNDINNLELWTTAQPRGQRVEDRIAWCIDFLSQHGYEVLKPHDF